MYLCRHTSIIESHAFSDFEIYHLLIQTARRYRGISKKGIHALTLKYMGYTGNEIAQLYGVKSNHISAWIARAVKKMRTDKSFIYI